MTDCRYYMDISPYPALCEHPCTLYGGGPVYAECDWCDLYEPWTEEQRLRARVKELEQENVRLRRRLMRQV